MAVIDSVVLVEMSIPTPDNPEPRILSVIRTYDGKGRSDDDIDLLQQVCPERRFIVQPVSYVDR